MSARGDREFLDRRDAHQATGESVWINWKQLVPQLVGWTDEVLG
jgi:hypothetical protein